MISAIDNQGRLASQNPESLLANKNSMYVTVYVSKENDQRVKSTPQSCFSVHSAHSNCFVLSSKLNNKIRVAVPYYNVSETSVNNTPIVTVSSLYSDETKEATPQAGISVYNRIGDCIVGLERRPTCLDCRKILQTA